MLTLSCSDGIKLCCHHAKYAMLRDLFACFHVVEVPVPYKSSVVSQAIGDMPVTDAVATLEVLDYLQADNSELERYLGCLQPSILSTLPEYLVRSLCASRVEVPVSWRESSMAVSMLGACSAYSSGNELHLYLTLNSAPSLDGPCQLIGFLSSALDKRYMKPNLITHTEEDYNREGVESHYGAHLYSWLASDAVDLHLDITRHFARMLCSHLVSQPTCNELVSRQKIMRLTADICINALGGKLLQAITSLLPPSIPTTWDDLEIYFHSLTGDVNVNRQLDRELPLIKQLEKEVGVEKTDMIYLYCAIKLSGLTA